MGKTGPKPGHKFSDQHNQRVAAAKLGIPRTGKLAVGVPRGPYKGKTEYPEVTVRANGNLKGQQFRQDVVVKRDGNHCQSPSCTTTQQDLDLNSLLRGSEKKLQVHHYLPYERFKQYYKANPNLYYEISGVITLCPFHHHEEDKRLDKLTEIEILLEFQSKTKIILKS
jgi:hypothetical protein